LHNVPLLRLSASLKELLPVHKHFQLGETFTLGKVGQY
jgi:hypothetical protein